jgi:MFS transporter, MHS family, shikimate and dehydroshikimate transport protein
MAPKLRVPALASAVGTSLEWYDFSLYSTAAALVLPTVFFPGGGAVGVFGSFATFAVGFFARPIGGVIIGNLGDRFGRRQMLFLTLILMAVASTLIGVLPGYATAGVWAPVLLVVLRVLQGFGAGGEYAGATLLAAEHAQRESRGLNASIPAVGNAAGTLLATIIFAVVSGSMSSEAFLGWGWRIPFLLSVLVGIAGIVIRLRIAESPEFVAAKQSARIARVPIAELFRSAGRRVPGAMLASIGPNVASYLPSVYALTYLATVVHAPAWWGLVGIIIANALKFITIPTAGMLSDRFGRRPVFIAGALGVVVFAFPFFFLLDAATPVTVWIAMVLVLTLANDCMLASQSAFMSELFDVRLRYTGVTFTREISGAIVGGTLPFIAAWLTSAAGGGSWLVSVYCIVLGLLAVVGMLILPETRGTVTGRGEIRAEPVRQ